MKVVFSENFPQVIVKAYESNPRIVRESFVRTEQFLERAAAQYSFMNMNGFSFQIIQFDETGYNAVMIFKQGGDYFTVTISEE